MIGNLNGKTKQIFGQIKEHKDFKKAIHKIMYKIHLANNSIHAF